MNVRRDSLGNAPAFLVVESDHFFSREGAAAIRDIVDQLEQEPTIESVQWLDQAPPLNIFGLSEPILPRGQASPAAIRDRQREGAEASVGRRDVSVKRCEDIAAWN